MKCPGQNTAYWKPSYIYNSPCPKCGTLVEFFKDDSSRKCSNCKYRIPNPKTDFGCLAYCQHANQCKTPFSEDFTSHKETLLKNQINVTMEKHLKNNPEKIKFITCAAKYAEQICKIEGGNISTILPATYLYNNVNKKKINPLNQEQQILNMQKFTQEALESLNVKDALIKKIISVMQELITDKIKTLDAKIVNDANIIATFELNSDKSKPKFKKILTRNGYEKAKFLVAGASQ